MIDKHKDQVRLERVVDRLRPDWTRSSTRHSASTLQLIQWGPQVSIQPTPAKDRKLALISLCSSLLFDLEPTTGPQKRHGESLSGSQLCRFGRSPTRGLKELRS